MCLLIVLILLQRLLRSKNTYLESNAVRLCNLDKDHFVLEAGFGLGIGMKRAAQAVQSGMETKFDLWTV